MRSTSLVVAVFGMHHARTHTRTHTCFPCALQNTYVFSQPQGTKTLPPVLISTLRSCRGATLVYKEAIGAAPRTPQGGGGASRAGFGPGSAAASAAATAAANEKAAA